MIDFDYEAPTSLDQAVAMLAEQNGRAKLLAGGTDLIVQLREGLREADVVIDVKKIPELMVLDRSDGLRLGAAVSCHRINETPELAREYASLVDATRIVGGWQIQSRASVGGNVCNASPAADTIPALIAEDARCVILGPKGERTISIAQFCVGPGRNSLEPGELLIRLDLPPSEERAGSAYERFIPRNEMDIAVVGAGSWLRLDATGETVESARIGLGAVAPTPLVAEEASAWLAGKPATKASFEEAGSLARKIARPISDMRGPADFRVHLVGVLVRRTLETAAARARAGRDNGRSHG